MAKHSHNTDLFDRERPVFTSILQHNDIVCVTD